MLDLVRWFIVLEVMGLAALPLSARAFRNLPDRGYAFARPVGALAVAVALWFGSIFGLWSNSGGTVIVLILIMGAIGWFGFPRAATEVRGLWTDRRAQLIAVEGLFIVAFVGWAFVRAHVPNIEATEKPMELGFLNGIIRSQRFPPVDPWLAGYSISYYYLGYVVIAAITEVSGVVPSIAFNLAIATLFAMTVTGAFALGHAIVDGSRTGIQAAGGSARDRGAVAVRTSTDERPGWIVGGVTAAFVALLGNLEGGLEVLHAHGVGSAQFWQSLAVWQLGKPYISQQWFPNEGQDNWWWFRATRVILDYPVGTTPPEGYNTISEFPFFSFLLGDLHPHVLALPFAFVCLAFSLSFLREPGDFRWGLRRSLAFDAAFIVFIFGSMFLLNAWDILTYLFVLVCAFAARHYLQHPRFDLQWLGDVAAFGIVALLVSILAYFPFYLTFRSQATGLLGIVRLHSHLNYFLLFWGPLLFLAASLVAADLLSKPNRRGATTIQLPGPGWIRRSAVWFGVAVVVGVAIYADAPAVALTFPIGVGAFVLALKYLTSDAAGVVSASRRDPDPYFESAGVTQSATGRPAQIAGGAPTSIQHIDYVYVLLLLFVAMLLLLGTELVFIQDSFNNRMNTVFKLYFQAWELLAVVGGYAVYVLGRAAFARRSALPASPPDLPDAVARRLVAPNSTIGMSHWAARIWLVPTAVLIVAAGVYAPAALESRTDGFSSELDLNGLAYYTRIQPDDAAGIAWLNQNVSGSPTIVEASGGSYSAFAEVAWMTGLPTILGWDFHEIQWHGAPIIPVEDERKRDIEAIYRSSDWKAARELVLKYRARLVYVGPMERQAFPQNEATLTKFSQFMDVVYRNPSVTIYQARGVN